MSDLSKQELQILLKAYKSTEEKHAATKAAMQFSNCGFGTIRSNKWIITGQDRIRIREFLIIGCNIRDPDTFDVDFSEKSRIESALHVDNEKFAGKKPREGRILIRGKRNAVQLNGKTYELIGNAALDVDLCEIKSIDHDCLMFVENFEAFICAEKTIINNFRFANPLYVYRGDNLSSPKAAKKLAEKASLPVVVFADFDPQGLNIAASTPNIFGAIFPVDHKHLQRNDLFIKQRNLLGSTEKYPKPWRKLIAEMIDNKRGMGQEHMIAYDVECGFFQTF
jgi:hypothetical protein